MFNLEIFLTAFVLTIATLYKLKPEGKYLLILSIIFLLVFIEISYLRKYKKLAVIILAIFMGLSSTLYYNYHASNILRKSSRNEEVINASSFIFEGRTYKGDIFKHRGSKYLVEDSGYEFIAGESYLFDGNIQNIYFSLEGINKELKLTNALKKDIKDLTFKERANKEISSFRRGLLEKVENSYSENCAALISSLTIGNNNDLMKDKMDTLKVLGLVHIISISGFHIGLLDNVLKKLKLKRLSIIIILMYCTAVSSIPAMRSGITKCLEILLVRFRIKNDFYNNLLLTAIVMLMKNPYYIFNLSFQLTFLSMIALTRITPIILKKMIKFKIHFIRVFNYTVLENLSISISSFILTAIPLSVISDRINLLSFIPNIVLLPLYTLLTFLSFIALIIMYFPFIPRILDFIYNLFLSVINVGESFIEDNLILNFMTFRMKYLITFLVVIFFIFRLITKLELKDVLRRRFKVCTLVIISVVLLTRIYSIYPIIIHTKKYGREITKVIYNNNVHYLTSRKNIYDRNKDDFIMENIHISSLIGRVEKNSVSFTDGKVEMILKDSKSNYKKDREGLNDIIISEHIYINGKFIRLR